MTENVWPQYEKLTSQIPFQLGEFIFNLRVLRAVLLITAAIALYLVGIFTPLPTLRSTGVTSTSSWWFLALLDQLFTAGAFGRGSVFCLGLFATFALGRSKAENQSRLRLRNGLLRRVVIHIALALFVTLIFALQDTISHTMISLAKTWFWITLGGFVVMFINKYLVRYNGPQLIQINIFLLFYAHFDHLIDELATTGGQIELYLAALGMLLIAASAYYVFRTRFYLEVKNIKSYTSSRFATLELGGVDELTLDLLGLTSILLFLCIAGVVSLLTGWKTISSTNFLAFAFISMGVLLLIWAIHALTSRMLTSHNSIFDQVRRFLDTGDLLAMHDAFRYAHRMLNNFWIIPNVAAGQETEMIIEDKMRQALNKSFMVFVFWFVVTMGIQLYTNQYGSGILLFPYGPIVFIFLFLMCIGYVSMLVRHLRMRFSRFKQMKHGKSRVMTQTYTLPSPNELGHLYLGESDVNEYWEEEKLKDQIRELIDYYRLLQQAQIIPRREALPWKKRILAVVVPQLLISLVSGVTLAFLGGVLYVILVPVPDDIWTLVIPLFLTGLFFPNVIWERIRKSQDES